MPLYQPKNAYHAHNTILAIFIARNLNVYGLHIIH